MKKLVQPASLLLYLLSLPVFFVAGATITGLSGAAEGQGLAGGAIVFMYGLMTAFGALILAMFISYYCSKKLVIRLNQILGLLLLICAIYIVVRINNEEKGGESSELNPSFNTLLGSVNTSWSHSTSFERESCGMGFYQPHLRENGQLYFYGYNELKEFPGPEKAVDSILFSTSSRGDYEISSAPPWLVPHHMKLDYGILLFKVISIEKNYIEIVGNKLNGRSYWVSRSEGRYMDWPDFLLNVFSISQIDPKANPLKVKPLDHAGLKSGDFDILEPVMVKGDYVKVNLYNDGLEPQGTAWLKWKSGDQLLISYSLLS